MQNYKDGGFRKGGNDFGGRPKFGGNKFSGDKRGGGKFGGGDRGGRAFDKAELFSATCSECRKACEVPFRPSSDKPVYCSACFGMKNDARGRDERGRDNFRNDRQDYARSPREDRSPHHDASRGKGNNELATITKQLATIVSRLDRILDLINPPIPPTKAAPIVKKVEDADAPKKERSPGRKSKMKNKIAAAKEATKTAPKKTTITKVVVAKDAVKAKPKKVAPKKEKK